MVLSILSSDMNAKLIRSVRAWFRKNPSQFIRPALLLLLSLICTPLIQAQNAQDLINQMRSLRDRDWGHPDTSTPASRGPSAHQVWQEKENARLKRAARAGKLNTQAHEAWERRDYREALRLFRDQQAVIDGPNVRESIAMAKAAILSTENRAAADKLLDEAKTTFEREDHRGALALYQRALATDPTSMSDEGKTWVRNLDARLSGASAMLQTMDKFPATLSAAPSAGGLDFISTGSTVVDARHVPSGLPKSIEDTIPDSPAGHRVRKGFQAIADHDWVVAKAWFEDALNHEPGDPGLQRLVDLAQFTLQKNHEKPAPSSPPERMSADEIEAETAIIGNALEAAMNEDFDKSLNDYLDKHPEVKAEQIQPPPTAVERKPASDQSMPLPPKAEIKFSWKAFADALFKPLPKSKYPQVGSVRG